MDRLVSFFTAGEFWEESDFRGGDLCPVQIDLFPRPTCKVVTREFFFSVPASVPLSLFRGFFCAFSWRGWLPPLLVHIDFFGVLQKWNRRHGHDAGQLFKSQDVSPHFSRPFMFLLLITYQFYFYFSPFSNDLAKFSIRLASCTTEVQRRRTS